MSTFTRWWSQITGTPDNNKAITASVLRLAWSQLKPTVSTALAKCSSVDPLLAGVILKSIDNEVSGL